MNTTIIEEQKNKAIELLKQLDIYKPYSAATGFIRNPK